MEHLFDLSDTEDDMRISFEDLLSAGSTAKRNWREYVVAAESASKANAGGVAVTCCTNGVAITVAGFILDVAEARALLPEKE